MVQLINYTKGVSLSKLCSEIPSEAYYDKLLCEAVGGIEGLFNKGCSVVILVTPGSSRGEVVKRIASRVEGVEFLLYEELHDRVDVENKKPLGDRGVEEALNHIKGGRPLAEALKERRVVVVPKSTVEAQALYEKLRGELRGEDAWRVAIHFLPEAYMSHLNSWKIRYPDIAVVTYNLVVGGKKGVSLKLLEKTEEEAKRGVETLRKLSLGRLSMRGAVDEAMKGLLPTLLAAPGYALGASVLLPLFQALLEEVDLKGVLDRVGGFIRNLISRLATGLPEETLKHVAKRMIDKFSRKGEPRDMFLSSMARLLKAIIEARPYIDDEHFETIVDEVASEWGLDIETFKDFIDNMYKIAVGRIVTEQEIEDLKRKNLSSEEFRRELEKLFDEKWEEYKKEVEDRLNRIKRDIKRLRKSVKALESDLKQASILTGIYRNPRDLRFDLEKGVFRVDGSEYTLVRSEAFDRYVEEIKRRIASGELIVLTGPKGVGKSVLARYTLAELLRSGSYIVYGVGGLGARQVAEYMERLHLLADRLFEKRLILYYDPSGPERYRDLERVPELRGSDVVALIRELAKFSKSRGIPVVIVLSSDILENVLQGVEGYSGFIREYAINVDLREGEFLANIVKAYSEGACSDDRAYMELGRVIAEKYQGGYTLVARYVGEWLKKNRCRLEEAEEAVRAGAGNAKAFIAQYLYKTVFRGNIDLFKKLTIPFIVRAKYGPIPPKWLEQVPVVYKDGKVEGNCYEDPLEGMGDEEKAFIRNWLARGHEDIVEEVIRGIAQGGLAEELKRLAEELKRAGEQEEIVAKITATAGKVEEMEEWAKWVKGLNKVKFNEGCAPEKGDYKPEDLFFNALSKRVSLREEVEKCPEYFALVVGFAHSLYIPAIKHPIKDKCRDLYEWLTVDGVEPPSARIFLFLKASSFADIVDVCSIVSEVYNEAEKKKGLSIDGALVSIGSLAVAGGRPSNCLEKVSKLILLATASILGSASYLEGMLEILIGELINRGLVGLALAIVYSAKGLDPIAAIQLYNLVIPVLNEDDEEKLSWAESILLAGTRVRLSMLDPDVLSYIVNRVNKICERYKGVICHFAESILGVDLAILYDKRGDAQNRDSWLRRAEEALEKLKTLSKSDEGTLARDLADWLELKYLFTPSEEALRRELGELNRYFNYHAALIKLRANAQEASGYAERACEEAKKLNVLRDIVSSCNLKAKAYFIQGREEEAIKLFKENVEDAVEHSFLGMNLREIANTFAYLVASHVAEGDLEKAFEEYKRHEHFIANYPADWALLTGLMVVHGVGELEGVFKEARRVLLKQRSPLWIKLIKLKLLLSECIYGNSSILKCMDILYSCEECVSVDPCEGLTGINKEICRGFVELANEPKRLKEFIITVVEGEETGILGNILKVLLGDINDYGQITEVIVLINDTVASFAEALRLISHGEFGKARAIAEYRYKRLGKVGLVQASQLWRELDESLKEERCGDRCRKALQKLFFFIV